MKRTLVIIALLSVTLFCFADVFQAGIGVDFNGKHNIKYSPTESKLDVDTGYSVYGEYMAEYGMFLFGAGAEYQIPRLVKWTGGEGKVSFIPVYLVGRVQAPAEFIVRPGIVAQVGYSFFTADDDYRGGDDLSGGIYYGVGAELQFQRLVLQLMYKVDTGKVKQDISNAEIDVTQSQVNLSAGFSY